MKSKLLIVLYFVQFAGRMVFGEVESDTVRPIVAAMAMLAVACVKNHDVGLIDLCKK